MYKIAGALAKRGGNLDEVYKTAEYVSSRLVTIGVGLEHCHVPGTAATTSHLSADEIEIGMGIHNESGVKRLKPAPALSELLPQLLDLLTSTSDPERSFVPFKGNDEVVRLVRDTPRHGRICTSAFKFYLSLCRYAAILRVRALSQRV